MFVDCCYCKRASWKIGLESNELPSLNKEFTYLLTYLLCVKYFVSLHLHTNLQFEDQVKIAKLMSHSILIALLKKFGIQT